MKSQNTVSAWFGCLVLNCPHEFRGKHLARRTPDSAYVKHAMLRTRRGIELHGSARDRIDLLAREFLEQATGCTFEVREKSPCRCQQVGILRLDVESYILFLDTHEQLIALITEQLDGISPCERGTIGPAAFATGNGGGLLGVIGEDEPGDRDHPRNQSPHGRKTCACGIGQMRIGKPSAAGPMVS